MTNERTIEEKINCHRNRFLTKSTRLSRRDRTRNDTIRETRMYKQILYMKYNKNNFACPTDGERISKQIMDWTLQTKMYLKARNSKSYV